MRLAGVRESIAPGPVGVEQAGIAQIGDAGATHAPKPTKRRCVGAGVERGVRPAAHPLERRGDDATRNIMIRLQRSLVTPIDREDIQALATQLDDVLDEAFVAASFADASNLDESNEHLQALASSLLACSRELSAAVDELSTARPCPCIRATTLRASAGAAALITPSATSGSSPLMPIPPAWQQSRITSIRRGRTFSISAATAFTKCSNDPEGDPAASSRALQFAHWQFP